MTTHTYTPGQRVTIHGRIDHPHFFVGMTRAGLVNVEDANGHTSCWVPTFVTPYVEPEPAVTEVLHAAAFLRTVAAVIDGDRTQGVNGALSSHTTRRLRQIARILDQIAAEQ